MTAETINGELTVDEGLGGFSYAFLVDAPNYTAEYFIPFDWFVTNEGGPVDLTGEVGFDVYICESDEGDRNPDVEELFGQTLVQMAMKHGANMDNCGIINFEGADLPDLC